MAETQQPSYEDMQVGASFVQQPGVSQKAKAQVEAQLAGGQASAVEGYFQDQKQIAHREAKLSEVKAQTDQMKKAMKLQGDNFDETLSHQRRLESLDAGTTKILLEEEKRFKLDSAGRKMLSERQIADWYNTKAATEEDWQGFQQRQQQLHDRKIQVLQVAYNRISIELEKEYKEGAASLDRQTREYLTRAKAALNDKIRKEKTKAANAAAMTGALSTMGSLAGGAAGAVFTMSPWGAAGGAAAGGLAGAALGNAIFK